MAFHYRSTTSPRDEPQVPSYTNALSPQRNPNRLSGSIMTANVMATNDVRGGLTRRFTTNALPTLTPIGQQRKQAAGDYNTGGYGRKTPSETAARAYESLLLKQRELQAQLAQFDPETRREVEDGLRHEEDITRMMASSEPASPPDYTSAFPSAFSRPNRYSTTSLTSPPGIVTRPRQSSTQLTSPSAGFARPYTSGHVHLPSQSVPGSRRHSDDEEEDDSFHYGFETGVHRAAANPNRNSMPITGYDRSKRNTTDFSLLGSVNTTGFLFDDDEDHRLTTLSKSTTTSPPNIKTFLQVQQTADGFPQLIRREGNIDLSSSALDLAFARGVEPQQQLTDRATASRHRISLPPSALIGNVNIVPLNGILANAEGKSTAGNRRSMEVKFAAETKRPSLGPSPPRGITANGTQKAMSSYSTNDIPTLKSINGDNTHGGASITSPPSQSSNFTESTSSAEPNSGILSRITSISNNTNHQGQDFTLINKPEDNGDAFTQYSGLQANAAPFGPMGNTQDSPMQNFGQNAMPQYNNFYGYNNNNMSMIDQGFSNMNVSPVWGPQVPMQPQGQLQQPPGQMLQPPTQMQTQGQPQGQGQAQRQWQPQMNMYGQQNGFNGYQQYGQGNAAVAGAARFGDQQRPFADNQRMTAHQRRVAQEEAQAKYNSISVDDLTGEIYGLCKDQHGCRFLQRKLDERDAKTVQAIFVEVKEHIIELMTDPFGNYLCQKLLESTNDEQRTALIKNAMPAMTKIALNQHGTRALQKMIEFVTTPEQTNMIIEALRFDVVQLIQDLNGNHVIQKCLNHLSPENAQFIFDAVGANCTTVGTHRHGCCVLQRCIDHASGLQKGALVDQVIKNAFSLVQDPFGNYVVQYILDLAEPCFTDPLCQSFYGNVAFLSKQKFSSNVIEKCIRCAGQETKRLLVLEITAPMELEKLLRDSFANYVVQTAMDFADPDTKSLLIENIRPILPSIRHTPYGRRIQGKISEYDGTHSSGVPSGVTTPADHPLSPQNGNTRPYGAQNPLSPQNGNVNPYGAQGTPATRSANRQGWAGPPPNWSGNNGVFGGSPNGLKDPAFVTNGFGATMTPNGGDIASPTPQRHNHSNSLFAADAQNVHGFNNPAFAGMSRQAAPYGQF